MSEPVICAGCGKALAAGSSGGLCPACLLRRREKLDSLPSVQAGSPQATPVVAL